MSCAKDARKIAEFLVALPIELEDLESAKQFSYYHIGALLTDVVLQAGLNYKTVVKPRIQKILLSYPEDYTISKFKLVIAREGLNNVISWEHNTKLERFTRIIDFAQSNQIDTCDDLKLFFSQKQSYEEFLSINGFGPKSLDYLLKLLNVDTVAVDRHIYSFVKMANVEVKGYKETKKAVEYAADFLDIPRSTIDMLIWKYMSEKKYLKGNRNCQASFQFLNSL